LFACEGQRRARPRAPLQTPPASRRKRAGPRKSETACDFFINIPAVPEERDAYYIKDQGDL